MRPTSPSRRVRKNEHGYALVLIIFLLALLALSTVVAAPTIISSVQREKEAEMVWRGKQYTRGIRMYYQKMHRFPTSLEDLTEAKNNIRFMRKAYKDPMNPKDGSWRLIYVGPNGQLIGSLNYQNLQFGMFGSVQTAANGVAPQNTAFGGTSNSFGTSFGNSGSGFGNSGLGTSNSAFGNSAATATASSAQTTADGSTDPDNPDQSGQPRPLVGALDSSNTVGGNIIGVGSKVNKKSFLWYKKAKNYRLFEFVWDPSKDTLVGGASRGIGAPINGQTGAPGTVNPTPQQNPQQNQNPANPDPMAGPPLQAPPSQ